MPTITIEDAVHRRLTKLKGDWQATSVNAVMVRLLEQAESIPKSMFGVDPTLPRLDRKRRQQIWD